MADESHVALVTGASRGIGRGIAIALAAGGTDVVVNYTSDAQAADETARLVEALGRRAYVVQGDVADSDAVDGMVATARRALGPISILINNAGIVELEDIGDFTDASWDRVMGVNLVGPANCVRACAIDIRAAGGLGRIVNIGSVLGRWPLPGRSAYAASKAGLEMLTQVWALEFGPAGATANMVVPGTIESDMTAPVLVSAESRAMTAKPIPLRRIGTPADIGAAVSFLCTAAAGYITGVSILVDGGLSLTPDARGATGNPMPARGHESPE